MSNKKKRSRIVTWLRRNILGKRDDLNFMEEEALQSPFRTIVQNFTNNKLAMLGMIVFLATLIFVLIGPRFFPNDLSYQDNTQMNVPPTVNMMKIPAKLLGNVRDISPGTTYSVGVSNDGEVFLWGYTKITDKIDLMNIPQEVKDAHIVSVAAGYDHVVALDDAGKIYVWGNDRLGQGRLPTDIDNANRRGKNLNIKQIEASFQFSGAVTEDGQLHLWGNSNLADLKIRQKVKGKVEKIALTSYGYIALLKDGSVAYGGFETNALSAVPESLASGVVDIAATTNSCVAVKEDGSVVVWGNANRSERIVPEMSAKPVEIYGGRYHFTALLENGEIVSWGDDHFGQTTPPQSMEGKAIETIYTGFYQNYAIDSQGEIHTWGLKGYLLGTDDFGRDILTRIINGGKTTMTVGAVSVIISLLIGIIMGGLAGYFGGKIDMLIMRIAEIVGGLPFLPFALILSAIIGTRISVEQRMYLIMVVLGVLSWTSICRLVRAQILAQREMEFVTAAKAIGVKEMTIVFKHILPNVISILLVEATLLFATCMLTESTLSYLGFGISPPTPTWGNMLTGANNSIVIQQYWWRWVFPASIFGLCTICINLMGDGMRDAIDPKSAER